MTQLNLSNEVIFRRRLGFYLVAIGTSLFTIDFGCDRHTMQSRYRVTYGSNFEDCVSFDAALGYCRFLNRERRRKAR